MAQKQVGWTESEAIDWDKISTEAPPPLPVAIYQATIVKAVPEATNEGKPAISVELRVTQRYGEAEALSRKMFDKLGFGGAAFKVKQLAQATGTSLPPNTGLEAVENFCAELVAAGPVWLRSKLDTYTPKATEADPTPAPKTNAKVDRYLSEEQSHEAAAALAGQGEQPAARRARD